MKPGWLVAVSSYRVAMRRRSTGLRPLGWRIATMNGLKKARSASAIGFRAKTASAEKAVSNHVKAGP